MTHLITERVAELLVPDDRLILARQEVHIEDAFGLCKSNVTVSLEDMEQAIRIRGIK